MKYPLIIGLPAKNEENSIYKSLESINAAAVYSGVKKYKIIVCVNDCKDNTSNIVKKFIKNNNKINCILINSKPGVVNAQKKIVNLFPSDVYVFPDADSKIDKKSIKFLLDELRSNSETIVAYAKTISYTNFSKQKSLAEKIGILYDTQEMLSPREYIHGRLFATKDWYIPNNKELIKVITQDKSSKDILKYCKNTCIAVDDIYLSSYIMNKYGLNAIKQIDSAHCYSWPIASFSDWHRVYRRRNIEMEKMKRWFPEYNYLLPHLNRSTNWSKWSSSKLRDKLIWLIYLIMKLIFSYCLKFEFLLLQFDFYKPSIQWKIAKSTKKKII